MNIDEMKNRISMALKDPTLQQGFEIICKNLVELEKENAELKEQLKSYNGCGDWDNDFHTCRVYLQHEELQECMEQLTKAKDILQRLMENQPTPSSMYEEIDLVGWREVNKEAEQFLKEGE